MTIDEQVREKFLALKKDAKPEIVAEFEEVRFLFRSCIFFCNFESHAHTFKGN